MAVLPESTPFSVIRPIISSKICATGKVSLDGVTEYEDEFECSSSEPGDVPLFAGVLGID